MILQKSRKNYLDITKGLAILLVIIGHLEVSTIIKNFIYSFHMPIFFYMAGVLYNDRRNIPFEKIKFFILNYIFFGLFFIILMFFKDTIFDFQLIYNLIKSNSMSIYQIDFFGVFWFILAYSVVLIISKIKLFSWTIVSFIIFIILYFIQNTLLFEILLSLPLCITPAFSLLLFYNIGKYHNFIMKYYSAKNLILILSLFLLFNILSIIVYNGNFDKIINYGILYFKPNILLVLLMAMTGIVSILYLSIFIELKSKSITKILVYFGQYSMFIFIWHLFILTLSYKILLNILDNENTVLFLLLKFCLSLVILVIGIKVYDKIKYKLKEKDEY